MFGPENILTWATFFPLAGAVVIVALTGLRFALQFDKRTLDQASRAVALVTSGLSLLAAIQAWLWYDPHSPGMVVAGKETAVQLVHKLVWIKGFTVEY